MGFFKYLFLFYIPAHQVIMLWRQTEKPIEAGKLESEGQQILLKMNDSRKQNDLRVPSKKKKH